MTMVGRWAPVSDGAVTSASAAGAGAVGAGEGVSAVRSAGVVGWASKASGAVGLLVGAVSAAATGAVAPSLDWGPVLRLTTASPAAWALWAMVGASAATAIGCSS